MNGKICIRDAVYSDLPSIAALLADDEIGKAREDASTPLRPEYARAFEEIAADPNNRLAVAIGAGGGVIGVLQLTFIPGIARLGAKRGQIEGVRIAPAVRGEGLGEAMFKWAIEEARRMGCSLVQLTTDKTRTDAHRFYDRLGFEASHVGYKLAL